MYFFRDIIEDIQYTIEDIWDRLQDIIYVSPSAPMKKGYKSASSAKVRRRVSVLQIKQAIYTIGFVLLCFIDQIRFTTPPYIFNNTTLCIGIIIGIMSMTAFSLQSFFRIPYLIWSVFAFISFSIYKISLPPDTGKLPGELFLMGLNYWIIGLLLIRLFIHFFIGHKWFHVNWVVFILWIFVMLGLIFSANDSFWPVWFLFLFGCFYLAPFTKEESNCLYNAMTTGILIGFALIQGFSFCFRLYDTQRYQGLYHNPNINAVFYVMAHAALLGKWYQLSKRNVPFIVRLLCIPANALIIGLTLMTGCRGALLAMIANTFLFFFLLLFIEHDHRFIKAGGRFLLTAYYAVILIPSIYAITRFIPAQYQTPVLLYTDSAKEKITKKVDVDDEKYTTYEFIKELQHNRILDFWDSLKIEREKEDNIFDKIKDKLPKNSSRALFQPVKVLAAAPTVTSKSESSSTTAVRYGSGKSSSDPWILNDDEVEYAINIRTEIWKYYYKNLNKKGHLNEQSIFWFTKNDQLPHAHNIILQFLFLFGKGAGFKFILFFILLTIIYFFRSWNIRSENCCSAISFLFLFAIFAFGMTDLAWQIGQVSFIMIFIASRHMFTMNPKGFIASKIKILTEKIQDKVSDIRYRF